MKTKYKTIAIIMLFEQAFALDKIKTSLDTEMFEIVSVSSTNMTVKNVQNRHILTCHYRIQELGYNSFDLEYNKELILIPDCIMEFSYEWSAFFTFTPVTYENQMSGFQILDGYGKQFIFDENETILVTNLIHYIALSDTPIQVSEDDVEMIMSGDWINGIYTNYGFVPFKPVSKPTLESASEPDETQTNAVHDTLDIEPDDQNVTTVARDEENVFAETQPPPCQHVCRAWWWWLLPLPVAGAILFLLRRRKNPVG